MYVSFKDKGRIMDFIIKSPPVMDPLHYVVPDPEIFVKILIANETIKAEMRVALNGFSKGVIGIAKFYINNEEKDRSALVVRLQQWIGIINRLKASSYGGVEKLVDTVDRIVQFSGKFDGFLQKASNFLTWQTLVNDLLKRDPSAIEKANLNVAEILNPIFKSYTEELNGLKKTEQAKAEIEQAKFELLEAKRKAEEEERRLNELMQEMEKTGKKRERWKRFFRNLPEHILGILELFKAGSEAKDLYDKMKS